MDASIIVASLAALGAAGSAGLAARGSRTAARETAASQERAAREASAAAERIEQDKLRREEIVQLRATLEAIIGRLNDEINNTREEVARVRAQLDHEEVVSDQLRARVRELEEQVHRLTMTVMELQQKLALSALASTDGE